MAIDLPPVIPPQESSAEKILQYVPANAATIRARIDAYDLQLTGNRYLEEQEVVDLFRQAKTPSDAIIALNNAYYLKGHLLTAVYYGVSNAVLYVHVTHGAVSNIDAPHLLQKQFKSLVGDTSPTLEEFESSRVMADIRSTRSGYDYAVSYRLDGDPEKFTLKFTERENEDYQPVSMTLRANNQGNRFLGRYFAGVDFGAHLRDSTDIKLSYDEGLVGLGEVDGGRSYEALNFNVSRIIGNGIYSLSGGRTDYVRDVDVPSTIDDCLLDLGIIGLGCEQVPIISFASLEGENTSFSFSGEQIVSGGQSHRIVLTQKLNAYESLVTNVSDGSRLLDESNQSVALGIRYYQGFKLAKAPARFDFQLSVEKGLGEDEGTLGTDTSPDTVSLGKRHADYLLYRPRVGIKLGLGDWGKFSLDASGQLSDGVQLPQQAQWVMGGAALSAYLPGVLVGDSGYYARLNWAAKPFKPWLGAEITPALFYEHATAWYEDVTGDMSEARFVSDAGLSIKAKLGWGLESSLIVAEPVDSSRVSEEFKDSLEVDFFWSLQKKF